jgi:hypothetical protein
MTPAVALCSPSHRHFSDLSNSKQEPKEQDWNELNKTVRNRAIRSFSILFVAMGTMAYALSQTTLSTKNSEGQKEGQKDNSSENQPSGSSLGFDFAEMEKEYKEFKEFQAFKRYKEQMRQSEQQPAEREGDPSPKTS